MNLDDRALAASQGIRSAVGTAALTSVAPSAAGSLWRNVGSFAAGFAAVAVLILAVVQFGLLPDPNEAVVSPDLPSITLPGIEDRTVLPPPPIQEEDEPTEEVVAPVDSEVPSQQTESEPTATTLDVDPPMLDVTAPVAGSHHQTATIRFEGTSEPGASVFAGRYAADVAENGDWAIVLVLSPGPNRAVFTATDEAGNVSTAEITVHLDEQPTTTTTKPPKDEPTTTTTKAVVEFSANQVYGSCALTPPYDVFWGTAQPGSVVSVSSEYGSGVVEVSGEGDWELKVFFETAPANTTFNVTVKSQASGGTKTFPFIYLPD